MSRIVMAGAVFETLALAQSLGTSVIGVVDPALTATVWRGLPAFADDDAAIAALSPDGVILAIDDSHVRAKVHARYARDGIRAVDLVAGSIDSGTLWGAGFMLQRGAHVSVDCRIGEAVRVNVGANIMHDVQLANYVTVAPNAVVLGRVRVGSHSYIGANATVLPDTTIGDRCRIGAGAVVTRDVAAGTTVKGVPARP
jgi:sugar O-acyltransferase (sialic acid O-acetyltransferase NeuD family)